MSAVLLLRLKGPMQAWGVQSRFTERDTLREPSKSGIVGLLAAALGRPREADVSDLTALRVHVRVEREGKLQYDYHTAGRSGFLRASGTVERKKVVPSTRYYLADAWFIVALEGERTLLEWLEHAVQHPHWPLALGRRAFAPSAPLFISEGLVEAPAYEALLTFRDPYWRTVLDREPDRPKRLVLEDEVKLPGWRLVATPMRPDDPISFRPRQFSPRTVYVYVPEAPNQE